MYYMEMHISRHIYVDTYIYICIYQNGKGLVATFPCSRDPPGSQDAGRGRGGGCPGFPRHGQGWRHGTRALGPAARKCCYQSFSSLIYIDIYIFIRLYINI